MIRICFYQHNQQLCGCRVSGHAGFAEQGEDIVCAGVSTAVQMTANMLTEIFKIPAEISVEDNCIGIRLPDSPSPEGVKVLEGFKLQMQLMKGDFPRFIQIKHTEV
ncbi:MAG: ribosomal-processing cysteine protease Prp [Ruminococcus sp.]|nr:ribosomal-processing cysteine protease Prp [Ruminococcus sp.]